MPVLQGSDSRDKGQGESVLLSEIANESASIVSFLGDLLSLYERGHLTWM